MAWWRAWICEGTSSKGHPALHIVQTTTLSFGRYLNRLSMISRVCRVVIVRRDDGILVILDSWVGESLDSSIVR